MAKKIILKHITEPMYRALKELGRGQPRRKADNFDHRTLNALFARRLVTRERNNTVKLSPLGRGMANGWHAQGR